MIIPNCSIGRIDDDDDDGDQSTADPIARGTDSIKSNSSRKLISLLWIPPGHVRR